MKVDQPAGDAAAMPRTEAAERRIGAALSRLETALHHVSRPAGNGQAADSGALSPGAPSPGVLSPGVLSPGVLAEIARRLDAVIHQLESALDV